MEYRNLGRSGLKVSQMALGTNAFGTRTDEATGIAIVHAALDAGINLIDTADMYGDGESERIIGKAIRDRRSRVVLATKGSWRVGDGPNDAGSSRQHILDAVDASLRRLNTDYIDLYQMHRWDDETPLEETLETLNDLVRWGKVRYIGCSNYAAWQIVKALGIQERRGFARYISHQPEYSPANRSIEREVIPACLSEGVGQIVYFPLAGGLFTGKYRRGAEPPAGSRAATQGERFTKRWFTDRNFDLMERLEGLAAEAGISLPHLVLAWVMAKPGITSAIVGATRVEQVLANVAACEVKLSPELIRRVDEASAEFV
ncbi:MAG TPA: aldo/keto reductase [Symbiobacteriaceae bacterium]